MVSKAILLFLLKKLQNRPQLLQLVFQVILVKIYLQSYYFKNILKFSPNLIKSKSIGIMGTIVFDTSKY